MSDEFNDALATLEEQAHRQDAEEKAAKVISECRSKLILGNVRKGHKQPSACFFATLALGLEPRPSWTVQTASTDGKMLWYNPDYIMSLPQDAVIGLVAHECGHPMLAHHARMGGRNLERWNAAADLSLNPIIRDSGFVLPDGGFFPGEGKFKDLPPGLSAEEYYELLPKKGGDANGDAPGGTGGSGGDDGDGDGDGQPNPDPGGCGGVTKAGDGSPAAARQAEAEWKTKVAQAAQVAKQRGQLPAGIARLVEDLLEPKVDWRDVLREFVNRVAKNDYSMLPPNRRYMTAGLYLPTLRSEELGEIVVAVDESGSIGDDILKRFASELQGILETFDVKLTILHHDAAVNHVQEWSTSDGTIQLEPKGGGGTDHCPVFEWVEERGMTPTCMVCLTDLYSRFPDREPDYPVLWCTVGAGNQKAPWGQQQVKVDD